VNSFECFKTYLGIKQHFGKNNYDYFRYHGSVNVTAKGFETRKDRIWFEKTAKKFREKMDAEEYFFALGSRGKLDWIGHIFDQSHREVFSEYKKNIESLKNTFKNDMATLYKASSVFDRLFDASNGLPIVVKEFSRKNISLESLTILEIMLDYTKDWDNLDPFLDETVKLIHDYRPFLETKGMNRDSYRKIILDIFE